MKIFLDRPSDGSDGLAVVAIRRVGKLLRGLCGRRAERRSVALTDRAIDRRKLALPALVSLVASFLVPPPTAQAQQIEAPKPQLPLPGEVTFGVGVSDEEVSASFDTLFPLYAPKDALLFLNPKITAGDELDPRVSLGLGFRKLFREQQVIVGGNVFYDSFDTINDHRINQLGIGAEVLTRWVDFRANYYLPEQNRHKIDERRTKDLSRDVTSATQALGPRVTSSTLAFQGNNLLAINQGVNQTQTTLNLRETETTRFWERYEAGMRGGDAEIGFLVPGLDRYAEVRVFGGYYYFNNDLGQDIEGFKTRLEVRALPAVTFDAMYYEDKEVIGSNWFFGMRISGTFDLTNMAHGRNPFDGFAESFKPKKDVDERERFSARMTENVMRTSRVSTSQSKFVQVREKKETYRGSTSYITSTPFTRRVLLTLGGAPITITHVNSAAAGAGNGTFETPYSTLTLANADAVKRNIVLAYADSVFNNQSIALVAGQQFLGEANGLTHLINTDQLGTVALPRASTGANAPVINNPGGAIITVADNVTLSGLNLSGGARGVYAPAGASNVTITNSTIANMTIAGIEIVPSNGTTIDNVTFDSNGSDVILNAFNTTLKNITSNNATNGAFKLSNTTGTTTITNVTVNNAAVFALQINNPGGTHNITNLKVNGGSGLGVDIEGGGGTFSFDTTTAVTNTGGAAFTLNGGTSAVVYRGGLTQTNNSPLVAVLGGHGGSATFQTGTLSATNGQGLLFDNADGTYNFLGTTTLNGGDAGVDILNGSAGTFGFGAGTSIVNPTGQGLFVNGGTASVSYAGSISKNNGGAAVEVLDHTTGTVSFLAGSSITATAGTGLQFTNDAGTYNFLGTTTLNGGDAGVDILASNGTFNFAATTAITNPTGTGFFVSGGQANVTYLGNINDNTGFALQVVNHSVGTVAFGTGTVTSTGGLGVQYTGDSGIYSVAKLNVTNSSGAALEVNNSATGTFTFNNVVVAGTAGAGLNFNNAGTISVLGGTINGTSGDGIFSQNTKLTLANTTFGNTTAIGGVGVNVINNDGTARLVTISNNNIRSTGSGIVTTDNGAAGGLALVLDGNTIETLSGGSKAMNITGSGLNSTIIRSLNGGTVIGNGTGGGLAFNRVTFDGDAGTAGNQAVAGGAWNIGQGTGARVLNDGLHLDAPTGNLGFTTLNIYNNAGTGLFVDTKTLGTTFALGNTGGVIDTTGGPAMNIDPLTTNLTFASVTSSGSGTSGLIVDSLTAGSSLTIGTTNVSTSAGDGIVVIGSAGATLNFGATTVTSVGGDGIDLTQAGNANVTFGATTINGFSTTGAGVNFTGSDVTATFGVTSIQNGGNGTGIDLSSTQNGRVITFATGSSISNVAVGVQLSSGGTTATSANANFTFGDGSGVDANGRNSTIDAPTTVAAIGLNPASGSYDFDDVIFTGSALFPAATGGALFVSSTAVNGAGDGSFTNPYSVADADAIGTSGTTFAFLDGTYNFATLNAGTAFTLASGQALAGLDHGHSFNYGTVQPVNISGDFGMLGGTVTRANTGSGTLSITNGAAASVFDLAGSNNLSDVTLTGEGGAIDPTSLISSNGGTAGFDNTTGLTISGVTMSNLQAGSSALALTNLTGSVQVSDNAINTTAGTLLKINGGTATYTVSKGTGTLAGAAVSVVNTTGGSVTVTGAALATNGNTAVTLNGNTATTTFTDVAITRTAGDTAYDIDATTASAGQVTVNGTSSVGSTAGPAFRIGAGARDIDASALNFTNAGTTAGSVISSTGQTGGTISFGNVGITGYNVAAGTAVSLAGTGGSVVFGDLDITTTAGSALSATGIGLTTATGSTLSATGGRALGLTNVTANLSFDSLASSGSTTGGVAISGTTGSLTVTGDTTLGSGVVGQDALGITGSSATFDFQGTTTISGSNQEGIALSGANGAVTFGSIAIDGTTGRAVEITGATDDVTFNGGSIGGTTVANGFAVAIANQVAGGTIAFNNVSTTASGPDDFNLTNNSGTVTVVGGTHTQNGGSDVLDVESLNATGVVNFGGTIVHDGSGVAAQAVEIDNSAGTINVTGSVTAASGAQTVLIGSGGAITGGAITFSATINQTGGAGLSIDAINAGTVSFTNTVTATGTTNSAISISNVLAPGSVTFSNVALSNILTGPGINLSTNAGTVAFNGGSINQVINGNGITAANSNLTTSGLSIGNNTSFAVNGRGIDVTLTGANTRTVSLTNTSIRSTLEALGTTDSATGTLNLALDGGTYEATTGVKAISVTGSALNSTVVRSLSGGTVIGNGTGGGVLFNRVTFDSDAGTAGNQQVAVGNWNIGQGIAARVAGDGLRFDAPTGDLAFGTLNIFNNAGTGLFADTKTLGTTFSLSNTGGAVNTTGGTAMDLDPLTTSLTFTSVTSANSGGAASGVILDTVSGSLTVGTLTVTNAGGAGLVVQNSSGNITFTNIDIDGAGSDGIRLAANTGSFTALAGGATTINNVTGDGIDLTGLTANPTVNLLGTVGITKFGGSGVNFTGAEVTAAFGVTTINNVANGGTGTAIDLSSTTGTRNIIFAAGSAISNVAVGVQIGATSGTAANANFVFGDGMSANGLQSSISATTTVAALGLDPAPNSPGAYNFNDVTLTGAVQFQSAPGNSFFVSATAVNGAGDGSFANPYSVADANAITGAANFAFLDGTYNFASLGANGFTLAANQSVAGLDNSNSIAYGVVQPNRVLGNFGVLGGTVTRANTGNGTLSITNGTAGGNVFMISGSNGLSNITLTGEAGVNDPQLLIFSNGGSGGFNNTAGITIQGVTISNVQAGSTALSFTAMTGTVLVQNNNLNASGGSLLNVNGGTGAITVAKGTGSTLSGGSIIVTGTTGGSVQVTGAAIGTSGNAAVTLDNNVATTTFTDVAITRTAGDTAYFIDSGAASTGAVTINGTSSIDSTAGRAFLIGAGARNINASAMNFTNAGTTAGSVISSTGQTGGTISFGNVGITGYNVAGGTAVSLAGTGGTVSFADLDVTTTAGAGLNLGAIAFGPGSSSTISTSGASALTANGTTWSGGTATFASITETGGANAISLTNVIGTSDFTTIALSGTSSDAVLLNNAGTVNLRSGSINGVTGHAINATNSNLFVGNDTQVKMGNTGAITGDGIRYIVNDALSHVLDVFDSPISNVAGQGINVSHSGSGTVTFNLGSNAVGAAGNAVNVVKSGAGNLNFAMNSSSLDSSAGTAFNLNGSAGAGILTVTTLDDNFITGAATGGAILNTVVFDANTTTAGIQTVNSIGLGITATGAGLSFTNTTGALSITSLNITNTGGTGLSVNSALTLSTTGGTIATTTGTALNLTNATLGLVFSSVGSTNAATDGIIIGAGTSGSASLGNVTVTGATGAGINLAGSAANLTTGTITVTNAATGLQFGANTGSFTATGATSLTGITGTGINANAATGTYSFQGVTIGYSGAGRGIDFRSSNLTSFQTGSLAITGNGTAGSIAIDLSGSLYPGGQPVTNNAPNIRLATGAGQTAAISAVNTGVRLGDGTLGTAGAYLRYGNQTATNSGSTIAVTAGGTTIDTVNLTSTTPLQVGRYEFTGVTFTGQASFEGTDPNFIFVGTSAAGSANGSNPSNRISTATFLSTYNTAVALAGKTVVFVNDSVAGIDLAGVTLNLGTNTTLAGFGNGASVIVPGGTPPVNVIGDNFVATGGTFTDGAGAATVHNNAGVNTLTLNTGNTLSNFILGDGGTSISGTTFGTLTVNGMVINNTTGSALSLTTGALAGTGFNSVTSTAAVATGVSLTTVTGTLNFGTGSITNKTGTSWLVSGGAVSTTYSGSITQASNAALLSVTGGHTGTLTFNTGALSATNGTGLQFDNADGTYNFNGTTTLNGGDAGIDILNGSSGTFSFNANTSITNPTGTGFTASGSTANVTYSGNITKSGASVGLLVGVTNETAGTITFQTGTLSSTSSAGTGINLNNVDSTVNFNGTTTLNGGNAHVDINTGTDGTVTFGTGATITSPSGTAFVFNGSTANVTYSGNITQANNALLVDITDQASGTITFQTGTLSATAGAGINLNNADGTVNFNGTTTLNGGDAGVDVTNGSNGNLTFGSGASITNPTGVGLNVNGGTTGTVAYNGTVSKNNAGFAVEVQNRTGGAVTVGGNLSATSASTGLSVHNNIGGTVTFSGASKTITTGANVGVTLATNAGSTVNFTNGGLAITTTTVSGFNATGGGTIGVSGANNTITSTTGTALNLASVTSGGITFRSVSTSGAANGMSFVSLGGGAVTISGDGLGRANGSGGSISNAGTEAIHMVGNSGTFTFTSMNLSMNTSATDGLLVDNNTSGTIVVNVIGTTFTGVTSSVSQNKALLQFEAAGTANVTANVQNSFFNGSRTYGFYATAADTALLNVTLNQSGFGTDVNTGAAVNRPGSTITNAPIIGMAITNAGSAQVDYTVTNNTFWGAVGPGAIYAVTISGGATTAASRLDGSFNGNQIGKSGVVGSGASGNAGGLGLLPGTNGSYKTAVIGNDIRQVNSVGVNFFNSAGGGANINATLKFKGNTVAEPDTTGSPALQRALVISPGNSGGANNPWIVEIGDTTGLVAADRNTFSGAWQAGFFVRVNNQNNTAALTMPGLTPLTGATAAQVNAFVQGANTFGAPATGSDVGTAVGTAGINGSATPLPLLAAPGGGAEAFSSNAVLTPSTLSTLGHAAISIWSTSGLTAQQSTILQSISFGIADLPANYVGETIGTTILLSSNAAGHYWFLDSTPFDNSEYTGSGLVLHATTGSEAAGRIDALSVLLHEIGHTLGLPDGGAVGGPLMEGQLSLGQRLLPEPGSALSPSAP